MVATDLTFQNSLTKSTFPDQINTKRQIYLRLLTSAFSCPFRRLLRIQQTFRAFFIKKNIFSEITVTPTLSSIPQWH